VYASSITRFHLPVSLLLGAWLGVSTSFAIDAVGHTKRNGRKVRSWTAHSIFTAPLWGASLGLLTIAISTKLTGVALGDELLVFSTAMGVLAGYSHLLLDSLTEGGIYLGRKRAALAHFRNSNLVLNSVFVVLGVLLALAGLGLFPLVSP